jgi:methyltransferase
MRSAYLIVLLVALQRSVEAMYGSRNARALLRRGGVEVGRRHYPLVVLLHTTWLITMALGIGPETRIRPVLLALFAVMQIFRIWVLATLGRFWTTRVITVPGERLVQRGPYRFVRHPNYLVVIAEIALLPLALGQIRTALVFSALNNCLLIWRIRVENAALADRRTLPAFEHGGEF